MSSKKGKIIVSKNGPYIVSGKVPLNKQEIVGDENGVSCAWREMHRYKTGDTYSLCRCGQTKTPPFCDGSHLKSGFRGEETASHLPYSQQAERYEGDNLNLFDAYDLCASARFCDRASGIWELIKKSDKVSQKTAIEEAADCPSGRLVLSDKKTNSEIEPDFLPTISVTEDPIAGVSGPLWVKGKIEIESSEGYVYEKRNRVTLCRCGMSENKPFCDSAHVHKRYNDGDDSLK